jgi:hypothetical protein
LALKNLKLKKNNVEFTVNLKELFGRSFRNQRALRELVGQVIIDKMVSRTKDGKAVGGKSNLKKPYSKEYRDSDEFKAFGKSKNNVNMTLTGDMLGLMDIKSQTGDSITIGWLGDTTQDNKAFNHSVGDTVPKRPFFGMTNEELGAVKSELKPEIKRLDKDRKTDSRKKFETKINSLISELTSQES